MGKTRKTQRALEHQNNIAKKKLDQMKRRLKRQKSRTRQKNLSRLHSIKDKFDKQPELPTPDTLRDWVTSSNMKVSELEQKLMELKIKNRTEEDEKMLQKLLNLQSMLQEKLIIEQCTRKKTKPRKLGSKIIPDTSYKNIN